MKQNPDRPPLFRRMMNVAALAVLLGSLIWTAVHWSAIPDMLPLRMNLNAPPTEGSKWRLILLPMVMLFVYLLLSYTEKIGVLNLPDLGSPECNQAAAREVSAGLKFFCVALIALGHVTMLTTSSAAPGGLVPSFLLTLGVTFAVLLIWDFVVRRG